MVFGNISCVNLDAVHPGMLLGSVFVPFEDHKFLPIPRWYKAVSSIYIL